ncbi:hypothetical protein L2E82_06105 [Cichorium intybus]|uniref:Uncharacterized protein n=1 Tax=Cichorium intybus TaxID=13427 RepID=A0ACB9H9N3_CICIN|nr:hypothetical protein L2E82_06105 [Cichorium intybus]
MRQISTDRSKYQQPSPPLLSSIPSRRRKPSSTNQNFVILLFTTMASNGENKPLVTRQIEPKSQIDCMASTKSRKLRRCRSAPMMEPNLDRLF